MPVGWFVGERLPSVDVMAAPVLDAPVAGPSPARTATLWVFRLLALPQAILFVLQPISIGSFLQGSWAAFDMHSIVGGVLVLPTMATAGVGPSSRAEVLVPIEGYRGRYVLHCHNLEHEDRMMMADFSVV